MSAASDPRSYSEQDLDQVVENYISKKTSEAKVAGQSPEEFAQGMETASFILSIKLLKNYAGGSLPTGNELLKDLATAMSASPDEVHELCQVFIQSGWMNTDYSLTEKGQNLSGANLPDL